MNASTIAAPWRHQRVTGRLARLTASALKAEAEHEGHDHAVHVPLRGPGDVPGFHRDEVHRQDAGTHHDAAEFRRQGKVPAADPEADQAGHHGDEQDDQGGDRFEGAVQRRVQRQDRDEGRSPECGAGTNRSHEQPAIPGRALGGAGAGKMAHADPGAEQANGASDDDEHLVVGKGERRVGRHEGFSSAQLRACALKLRFKDAPGA